MDNSKALLLPLKGVATLNKPFNDNDKDNDADADDENDDGVDDNHTFDSQHSCDRFDAMMMMMMIMMMLMMLMMIIL